MTSISDSSCRNELDTLSALPVSNRLQHCDKQFFSQPVPNDYTPSSFYLPMQSVNNHTISQSTPVNYPLANLKAKISGCGDSPLHSINTGSPQVIFKSFSEQDEITTVNSMRRCLSCNPSLAYNPENYSSSGSTGNLNCSYYLLPNYVSCQHSRIQSTIPRQPISPFPNIGCYANGSSSVNQYQSLSGNSGSSQDYYGTNQSYNVYGSSENYSMGHPPFTIANSYDHLNDHQLLNLLKIPKRNSEGKFLCPCCERKYKTNKHLKRHFYRHLHQRPYRCEWCNQKFDRTDILKRHVLRCKTKLANEQILAKLEEKKEIS